MQYGCNNRFITTRGLLKKTLIPVWIIPFVKTIKWIKCILQSFLIYDEIWRVSSKYVSRMFRRVLWRREQHTYVSVLCVSLCLHVWQYHRWIEFIPFYRCFRATDGCYHCNRCCNSTHHHPHCFTDNLCAKEAEEKYTWRR